MKGFFPSRYLVTSYKNEVRAKSRYLKRTIEISSFCPEDSIFWLDKKGRFKELDLKDGSIWQNVLDKQGYSIGYKERLR